ncbi:hypothetical protein BH18ACT1_BH18ACT1_14300 [soil metagenome]
MVSLDGVKMSKSLGNLVFVSDVLEKSEPGALRLAILAHSYRAGWDWTADQLEAAEARLDRWRGAGRGRGAGAVLEEVRACLDADLDTPSALAAIDAGVDAGHHVGPAAALIGVTI